MRLRGLASVSTVAAEAHTIECAISMNAGAIWSSGVIAV
jgi:hypothetical protein